MHKQVLVVFTYLVTKDIVETLESKGIETDSELSVKIKKLENEFLEQLLPSIPSTMDAVFLNTQDLREKLNEALSTENLPVVGLDRIYAPNADDYLSVTRITNPLTGEKRLGQRPGSKPLDEQIRNLKQYPKIALVDCGAFEGDTLLEIVKRLENQGTKVSRIYLAVSSYDASEKINKVRKLCVNNLFRFGEWIELRDFLGVDGRKTGEGNAFIPYWENLVEWASIPKEKEREVAELCRGYNRIMLELLKQDGYDVRRIGRTIKYEGGK